MGVKISVLVLLALFYSQQIEARRPTTIGYMTFDDLMFPGNQNDVDHTTLNHEIEAEQKQFYPMIFFKIYNYENRPYSDYPRQESQEVKTCLNGILQEVVPKLAEQNGVALLQSDKLSFANMKRYTYERSYHFSRTSRTLLNRTLVAKKHLVVDVNNMPAEDKLPYMRMFVENVRQKVQELRDMLGKDDPSHLLSVLLRGSMEIPLPSMSNCSANIVFNPSCAEEIFNRTYRSDYNSLMNSLKKYENHDALKEKYILATNFTGDQVGAEVNRLYALLDNLFTKIQDKNDLIFNKGADYINKFGSQFFGYAASQVSSKLSGTEVHYDKSPETKWCYFVGVKAYSFLH